MRLGPLHLTVSDLDRSVAFYQDAIGLQIKDQADHTTSLGTGADEPARPTTA